MQRIKFSGDENMFSMTMKNEKGTDHLQNFCLNGCNKDFSSNTRGPGIIDSEIKVF